MKGKPLLPTLRSKKRYVTLDVISDRVIDMKKMVNAIINSYKECFGVFGLSNAGIMETGNYYNNRVILKINHKYVDNLRMAIAMLTKVDGNPCIIHTDGVSGILNKAKSGLGGC